MDIIFNFFVGLRLDLDPDVVAAMDEDFDFSDPENELEDNFLELANQSGSEPQSEEEYDEYEDDESNYSSERYDDLGSLNDDAKSRFTEYSMTSSVISRNSQLTLLDETFEQVSRKLTILINLSMIIKHHCFRCMRITTKWKLVLWIATISKEKSTSIRIYLKWLQKTLKNIENRYII